MGVQHRKNKKALRYTTRQLEQVSMRAGRLYRTLKSTDVELIMDDDKFSMMRNESVSTNRGISTTDPDIPPSEMKFKRTQTYSAKVMVWIALSEKGISEPFFAKQ